VRWLRPDHQVPRFGTPAERAEQIEADLVEKAAPAQKPAYRRDAVERTAAVLTVLAQAEGATDAAALARRFRRGRSVEPQVRATLMALARMGYVAAEAGGTRFALRRVA
jgi:hypothetical protein